MAIADVIEGEMSTGKVEEESQPSCQWPKVVTDFMAMFPGPDESQPMTLTESWFDRRWAKEDAEEMGADNDSEVKSETLVRN